MAATRRIARRARPAARNAHRPRRDPSLRLRRGKGWLAPPVAVRAAPSPRIRRGARRALARAPRRWDSSGPDRTSTSCSFRFGCGSAARATTATRCTNCRCSIGSSLARAGDAREVRTFVGHEVPRDVGCRVNRALRRASAALGVCAGADEALRRRAVLSAEGGGGCARARPSRGAPRARELVTGQQRTPNVRTRGADESLDGSSQDKRVANVALGHEPIPERREPSLGEPREIGLSVGMVPEHRGPEVILDSRPALKTHDRE